MIHSEIKSSVFGVIWYFASSSCDYCVYALGYNVQGCHIFETLESRSDVSPLRQRRNMILPDICAREKNESNFLNITTLQWHRFLFPYCILPISICSTRMEFTVIFKRQQYVKHKMYLTLHWLRTQKTF